MSSFRIAVISDIHAYNSKNPEADKDVSHFDISSPDNEHNNHPITGLLKLISDESLEADILLSAGDVCDKACPVSLKHAWGKVQLIKSQLHAYDVISTAGNHDLDSRYKHNNYDAKGFLLSLDPMIPITNDEQCNKFWARNYVFYVYKDIRFLIINTSAYHGGPQEEIQHGRISTQTLQSIRSELDADTNEYNANVLLCHHHLLKHDELDNDPSVMEGGDKLIDLIGDGQHGDWLVIHGHKHHPKIYYAPGGGGAPVVFSAGSLCANLYPNLQTRARNQFHIVEFPISKLDEIGLGIAGCIYSWDWCAGIGWVKAEFRSGLPYIGYFGYRSPISSVARDIVNILSASSDPFMKWSEVLIQKPQFRYLVPNDLLALINILEKSNISITWNSNGSVIEEIGRKL